MVQRVVMHSVVCGIVGAALFLTGCAGIKAQTHSYETLAEARQAGAIANGWIPEGLPDGSHDIREGHVPGTTQRWGLFEYSRAEEATLRALMEPEEIAVEGLPCDVPARIEWWPRVLRGPLDASKVAATGARVYRAKDRGVLFAVNWNQGRAYYWSQ
jgi:hypothetical protein